MTDSGAGDPEDRAARRAAVLGELQQARELRARLHPRRVKRLRASALVQRLFTLRT